MSSLMLSCPQCQRPLSLPAALAGKQGRCPMCKHVFAIPTTQETSALRISSEPTVSHQRLDESIVSAPTWPTAHGPVAHPPGFVILAELGKGGMGVVYKAEQSDLKRLVALKMIRAADNATLQDRERFRAEAESLARLRHPNIVSIYEVGEHQGRPFFSLEYLEGGSLNHKLAGNPQPPHEAALLLEKLAGAVEAAHQANIIHRDLKPANILLTAAGEPKITDFGLAKQLDVDHGQTRTGAIMGTPSYMAPEQAMGLGKEVGPGADIYALGVILYEMLTGRPPFKGATPVDTLLQVAQDDPVPPSQLIKKLPADLETICLKCLRKEPAQRYRSAGELAAEVRAFLDGRPIQARPISAWERALKWSKRRPAAAALLAVSILATLGFLALMVYFTSELTAERNNAIAEKETAQKQKGIADDEKSKAVKAESDARTAKLASDQLKIRAEKGEEDARQQLRQTERTLFTAQVGRASGLWQTDPTEGVKVLRDLRICPPAERDFAWHFYHRLCQTERIRYENGQDGSYSVRFSPDGQYVVSGCHDYSARVWELSTGRLVHRLVHSQPVQDAVYAKDGKTIYTGGWEGKVRVWDADTGKEIKSLGAVSGYVMQMALHPEGEWLAVASAKFNENRKPIYFDGEVSLFHVVTGEKKAFLKGHPTGFGCVDFSPDGKELAAGTPAVGSGSGALLWDMATGMRVGTFGASPPSIVSCMKYSPSGRYVAYVQTGVQIQLWNRETNKDAGLLRGSVSRVKAIDFSPDGRLLASVAEDKFVRVWDVEARKELYAYRNFNSTPVGFTPDGKAVVAERTGHLVHIALPDRLEDRTMSLRGGIVALLFSPDSKHLASVSYDKAVRLWNPLTGKETLVGKYPDQPTQTAFSPDSRTLFVAASFEDADKKKLGQIARWDIDSGKPLEPWLGHSSRVVGIAVSKARDRLASIDSSRSLKLWDLRTGKIVAETQTSLVPATPNLKTVPLEFIGDSAILAAYAQPSQYWDTANDQLALKVKSTLVAKPTPDGKRLAVGSTQFHLLNIDDPPFYSFTRDLTLDQKKLLANPARSMDLERAGLVVFSPDGQSVAAADVERTIKVYDLASGQLRAALSGHFRNVVALAFSPDGTMLASGDRDTSVTSGNWTVGDIKIWNARPDPFIGHNGKPDRLVSAAHGSAAASMAFEKFLDKDSSIRSIIVWDRATGKEKFCLCRPEFAFFADYLLTADGKRLATLHHDGMLRLWDVAKRTEIARRQLLVNPVKYASPHQLAISADGKAIVTLLSKQGIDFLDSATLEPIKHWDAPPDVILAAQLPMGSDWFVAREAAKPLRMIVVFPEAKNQYFLEREPVDRSGDANGMARLDDDRLIYIQNGTGTIHDVRANKSVGTIRGLNGHGLEVSPDGKTLIIRHSVREKLFNGFEMDIYDVATGTKRRTLKFSGLYGVDLAWNGDELLIATTIGNGVRFWPAVKYREP